MDPFDQRLHELELKFTRFDSLIERDHESQRDNLEQLRTALQKHETILMGDGSSGPDKLGMVGWRDKMDGRYKAVVWVLSVVGTAVVELIREKVSLYWK